MRMTSRTFAGQSYALCESASTPNVLRWDAGEVSCQACDPDGDEDGKTDDGVQRLVGIGAVVGVHIGLYGVIEYKKKQRKNGAAEPGKPHGEEAERGFGLLRTEPVPFVGEVDQFGRQTFKDPWHAECEDSRKHDGADEECKKHRLRLPSVGNATTVEVGRDRVRQSLVAGRKIDRRKDGEQREQHFGKARIQVRCLRSMIQPSVTGAT